VTSHLLDAGERRAGDLVVRDGGVDADENTGVVALVKRCSRGASRNGRTRAANYKVDALQSLARGFSENCKTIPT
jgi:hypothetical protein